MKITTLLLTSYLLTLSVFPVMVKVEGAVTHLAEQFCIATCCEANPMCEEASDCSTNSDCTPCSTCVFGLYCFCCVIEKPGASLLAQEGELNRNQFMTSKLVSSYQADCFRPPEISSCL